MKDYKILNKLFGKLFVKKVGNMKFTEYRPGFVSGFENKVYNVSSLEEVFKIDFVKNFSKSPDFYCYAISIGTIYKDHKSPDSLMGLYKFNLDIGKCSEWWVIGKFEGFAEINLPKYETLIYKKGSE